MLVKFGDEDYTYYPGAIICLSDRWTEGGTGRKMAWVEREFHVCREVYNLSRVETQQKTCYCQNAESVICGLRFS